MSDQGYVDYLDILGLDENAKVGDVRKKYKQKMKDLVFEISQAQITEERRSYYLLEMAKLNAAFYILRDTDTRDRYWKAREEVIALESQWRVAVESHADSIDMLRRQYDAKLRNFLSTYIEELMLEAGRDRECVEASNWDEAHERHAFRILRHYRQRLYREVLERLPYYEITEPVIDWQERSAFVTHVLCEGGR